MTVSVRVAIALSALLAVGACNRAETPAADDAAAPAATAPTTQEQGGLSVEGEGLRLFSASGSATPIAFETPQANVIAAVAAALGETAPAVTTNEECGAGPMQFAQFSNGLQLAFQEGKFGGWFLDKAGLTTVDGVGVGSTRAALADARTVEIDPESTLGVEFTAGDISGFLTSAESNGTVESLYAGLTCFFR